MAPAAQRTLTASTSSGPPLSKTLSTSSYSTITTTATLASTATASTKATTTTTTTKAAHGTPANTGQQRRRTKLQAPSIYVRIRPKKDEEDEEEEDHAVAASASTFSTAEKQLAGWTDKSVSLRDRHGITNYTFPRHVFGPECSQVELYQVLCTHYWTRQFVEAKENVCFLAYGQTGTGKTHSIFGPAAAAAAATTTPTRDPTTTRTTRSSTFSLSSSCTNKGTPSTEDNDKKDNDDHWGLFPRLVQQILVYMKEHSSTIVFTLQAQAVEFYMFSCFDLLHNGAPPLALNDKHQPTGAATVSIATMADCWAYLNTVRRHRTAQGTRMNPSHAATGHGGSSRSHCALLLTLRQVDTTTQRLTRTQLVVVDLAGAERPGKNGYPRQGVSEALLHHCYGNHTSSAAAAGVSFPKNNTNTTKNKKKNSSLIPSQTAVINYELAELAKEVLKATTAHRRDWKYTPPLQCSTLAVRFVASLFNGHYRLAMLVCLSQAPSSSWETWFSLQYGTNLSKLATPSSSSSSRRRRRRGPTASVEFDQYLQTSHQATCNAQDALQKTPPTGAPSSQFYPQRRVQLESCREEEEQLQTLQKLLVEAAAAQRKQQQEEEEEEKATTTIPLSPCSDCSGLSTPPLLSEDAADEPPPPPPPLPGMFCCGAFLASSSQQDGGDDATEKR